MRRNPFALPRVCSPGSALAAEVQAAGRGPGPPSTCGIAQLRTGGTGGTLVGLMPSALGTERAGAELAGGGGLSTFRERGGFSAALRAQPGWEQEGGGLRISRGTEAVGGGAGLGREAGTGWWAVELPGNKWGLGVCVSLGSLIGGGGGGSFGEGGGGMLPGKGREEEEKPRWK